MGEWKFLAKIVRVPKKKTALGMAAMPTLATCCKFEHANGGMVLRKIKDVFVLISQDKNWEVYFKKVLHRYSSPTLRRNPAKYY